MDELKVKVRFSQRETMTVTENVLSKDVKIVPELVDFRVTDKDGKIIIDNALAALGSRLTGKRMKVTL